jgi:hypothetical protein
MKNEEFIIEVHSSIEFPSKWIYVAGNSIEDYMRNETLYQISMQKSSAHRNERV